VDRAERGFFVTEYCEGAVDGETWLKTHGNLDVNSGIAVGIEIAKALQVAHEKGIFHLDLKPANLLFKQTETGLMVKIIDFGLARVATSLRQEAMSRRSASGMSEFGQTVMGTLLYAPPEQLGEFDLLCDCKEENPALRPESAADVVKRLESIWTTNSIVVSPTGDCQSISAAIEKAKAGDRILVKQGVYKEDFVIDKPLEIIGDGEVVVESKNANCISMKTDHALVRGLSLHNRADGYYAVDISQGQLSLEYCDMTSDSLACVGIHGGEAVGILSHCQIHDGKGGGVYVTENGSGRIENCDIFGNALAGIVIRKGGNPVVQHCQIHDGKKGGVLVNENGTGRIDNCEIFGNLAGIVTMEGGNPIVQNCTIKQNSHWAVVVSDGGAGTIKDCDLRDNAKGAWYIESGWKKVVVGIRNSTINNYTDYI
jgi:parallel beta-helix repeat protein